MSNESELQPQHRLHWLCSTCRSLFYQMSQYSKAQAAQYKEETLSFHNIQTLTQSAADGCHLCSLIRISLDLDAVDYLEREITQGGVESAQQLGIQFAGWHVGAPRIFDVKEARARPGFEHPLSLVELLVESIDCSARCDELFRSISLSTGSDDSLRLIRQWLHTCTRNHSECRGRDERSGRHPPTRLIYVGKLQPPNQVQVHDDLIPQAVEYTTLSYCWGGTVPLRLLSSTYAAFKEGIRFEDLPKTFQDAVILTQYLNINYLWIDSLCIIQDSPSDWAQEAALMKDVYANSSLNIAANASFNPNGGLFQYRELRTVMPLKLNLTWQPSDWTSQATALLPRSEALHFSPLSTRAWCVQERLLAKQTVHFLKHKIIWECTTLSASESDPSGTLEQSPQGQLADIVTGWAVPPCPSKPASNRADAIWEKWAVAVGLYTAGALSFQKDKLIAISGIAKLISKMWDADPPVRYLAGLWSHRLEDALLWDTIGSGKRPADERAPSWSWCSIQGQVLLELRQAEDDAEQRLACVLEAKTFPIDDETGAVSGGVLRIEGPLFPVHVGSVSGDPANYTLDTFHNATLHLDEGGFMELACSKVVRYLFLGVKSDAGYIAGLILHRSGGKRGEYYRVGVWYGSDGEYPSPRRLMDTDDDELGELDAFYEAFDGMALEEDEYESVDMEARLYTVTVV